MNPTTNATPAEPRAVGCGESRAGRERVHRARGAQGPTGHLEPGPGAEGLHFVGVGGGGGDAFNLRQPQLSTLKRLLQDGWDFLQDRGFRAKGRAPARLRSGKLPFCDQNPASRMLTSTPFARLVSFCLSFPGEAFLRLASAWQEREVDRLINISDSDKDGKISIEELLKTQAGFVFCTSVDP